MPGPPRGTVTFLFTDIEASTRLLQRLGDRYSDIMETHRCLLRAAFEEARGWVVSNYGDEFFVAFASATDALAAAVAAQRAINACVWPNGVTVWVRMGIHTGEPRVVGSEYVGMDVHRVARICAAGHGGQILLSQTTRDLLAQDLSEDITLHDLGFHRLKDLAAEHLFQVAAPGLSADFPPIRSLDALPNNLPRQLTSFIGREREIAEIKRVLSTTSLVTLVGPAGSGKTRLALQVAADVLANYRDGVWLVELAPLSDPALIPKTVLRALGVREESGRPLVATLTDFARSRELLLVLDNIEHLLTGCDELVDVLLRACPDTRILATGREPLSIPGEVVWQILPLSLPDRRYPWSVDRLMQCEAARLFADRASLIQQRFAVTVSNAGAISQICTRLDGIPLAIELAAARVTVLAPEQIARRLDDRFQLLTGGGRTTLPRHQTLRAAMDWSYELLSDEEKTVLRRLSVFSNGWTLEAAEAICGQPPIRPAEVLDLLAQLVSKSLVNVDTEGREARYRQLETMREYGRDKLGESEEGISVGNWHRDWYKRLAREAAPELIGETQAAWLDRFEAEHDNLRAALLWSVERGEAEAGLQLAADIQRFWLVRGYLAEGRRWIEMLLQKCEGVAPAVRAHALFAAGSLAVHGQGDYVSGRSFYEQSLALWREIGERRRIADVLNGLGVLAGALGDQNAARARHEESLAIRRDCGDQWGAGVSLHNLGRVAYREGSYAAAQALFQESLGLWQTVGDKQHIAMALNNLGLATIRLGDYPLARTCLLEAWEILQKVGDRRQMGDSLEACSCLAAAIGLAMQAAQLFGAADALRERIGAPLPPADRPDFDHWMYVARRALGNEIFEAAFAQGRALNAHDALDEAHAVLEQLNEHKRSVPSL